MSADVQTSDAVVVPSRRDRRRHETRERLFEAAMQLFSEKGFDAVTVEMITEAANLAKGTFFNYFPCKEAVVEHFFELQVQVLTEAMPAILAAAASEVSAEGEHPLWLQMRAVAHRLADRSGRSRNLTRTLIALTFTNEKVREAHINIRTKVIGTFREAVRAAQEAGQLRNDLTPEELTEFLFGIYFLALCRWAMGDAHATLHDVIDATYRVAWQGVCPQFRGSLCTRSRGEKEP
ncbi:MAG: TetR/AcrR family transcriptional regulator [Chloroherpetonaceae bacterium]|nr:TetR/AcrR family transcriptional regulator [Chthonomonadaceae bacterium]MDW8208888.1 TetR/AcrR family transcriptional regulator [Chloroherpetonaceae bacterium]